jgi:hypothetical protein
MSVPLNDKKKYTKVKMQMFIHKRILLFTLSKTFVDYCINLKVKHCPETSALLNYDS